LDEKVKIRALNYGEYLDSVREADRLGVDYSITALSKALTIDGKQLKPRELLKIEPFGIVLHWVNKFNKINQILPEEQKKL